MEYRMFYQDPHYGRDPYSCSCCGKDGRSAQNKGIITHRLRFHERKRSPRRRVRPELRRQFFSTRKSRAPARFPLLRPVRSLLRRFAARKHFPTGVPRQTNRFEPSRSGELLGKKRVKYLVCANYVVASLRSIEKTDGTCLC
jgi:hypothetical protein